MILKSISAPYKMKQSESNLPVPLLRLSLESYILFNIDKYFYASMPSSPILIFYNFIKAAKKNFFPHRSILSKLLFIFAFIKPSLLKLILNIILYFFNNIKIKININLYNYINYIKNLNKYYYIYI